MSVRITVHDFGPIASGTVRLRPLTVLIGPNNAGKSYLAMLTYAANHRLPFRAPAYTYLGPRAAWRVSLRREDLKPTAQVTQFLKKWMESGVAERAVVPQSVIENLETVVGGSLEAYGAALTQEIERCFGRELSELTRVDGTSARRNWIEISHGDPRWTLRLDAGTEPLKIELSIAPDLKRAFQRSLTDLRRRMGTRRGWPPEALWEELLERIIVRCFAEFPSLAYYLPAARSGILQSHKLLASVIVSRSSFAGIEDMQVGKLTGVLSDFISHLLQVEPRRTTKLANVADFLESDVLKGQVLITGTKPAYPEIIYRAGEGKYPLSGTSSMVSELAPVVLFLRYLVDPGEMIVIEEPESHLHPSIQRKFARAIARLANSGVTVVLTTHSDYFLTQINNLILASGLDAQQRADAGYAKEECLEVSDVAAYLFKPMGDSKGTAVKRMSVTRARGISQAQFAQAAEALYAETVALERTILDTD